MHDSDTGIERKISELIKLIYRLKKDEDIQSACPKNGYERGDIFLKDVTSY